MLQLKTNCEDFSSSPLLFPFVQPAQFFPAHLGVAETGGDDEGRLAVLVQLVDVLALLQELLDLLQVSAPSSLAQSARSPGHYRVAGL